ncbi:MAG TPA: aminotransferase class V-fold PLP-dependent enzyme [Gaiellaceae bacterium]|nr:aminotransferase class V-fold PLP-dependent enzyme [Gaiellaceae bacterium]
MDVRDARAHFPGLADKTFLDAACVGLAPIEAKRAIEQFLEKVLLMPDRDASIHHIALDQARATAVREGARLLGADEDEIALVESTTHGLNILAGAIPWEAHDNVVICDLEFLQVAIPWLKLAERDAIADVRVVRNDHGAVTLDAFAALVDDHTRAVVVSSVQWTNGYAVDLDALAGLCRTHGALLIVDAIQQLGATRLSVRDVPADAVVAGGHKWLNAPFGCGLMYIRRTTLPHLRMPSWGYLGLPAPEGGWGRYFATPNSSPVRIYDFPTTTKSLEINGTANYPGAVGLGASLELVNSIGIDAITEHVLSLTDRLHEELPRLGVRMVTRPEREARSAITTFEVSEKQHENEAFLQALLAERIYLAMRYTSHVGGIRVSTHFYNDHDDLDRLLWTTARLLGHEAAVTV